MTETKDLPAGRQAKKTEIKINPEEILQAGLQFGHKTSRIHPKIKPYLQGARNGVNVFDAEKIAEKFKEALGFIKELVSEGKIILFVGTKIQVKNLVKKTAEACTLPYITERWLGGTFTNFETIRKRVEYFKELEEKSKSGELEKYTKKERANFNQELEKLRIKFEGVKDMAKLPEAIFVFDMKKDLLAVKEAKIKKVKIIGIADTNIDPGLADYPIPANDDAISSVKYILDKTEEVIKKNKK